MKPPKFYRKFNYNKSLLPNKHLSSLEHNILTIEEAKSKTGLSIGYPGWCLIYYILLSHLKPDENNLIVETGTNQGCTTIMLAQALRDSNSRGKIFTVELDKENYRIALANFKKAGVADLIEAINDNSKSTLKEIVNKHDTIRVAFLDASHLFNDVIIEFEIILPKLGPQSIVIFDNTYSIADEHEDQRVNGALKEILKRHGGNLVNFEVVSWYTPGIAIWQKSPFDSLKTVEANDSFYNKNILEIPQSSEEQSQNDIRNHSKEEIGLWETSKNLFPLIEFADFDRALECIAQIDKRIIGRYCGDLGDKLAQYLSIIQFFRASDANSADSIEIGTLFGGSCLIKLMAMRDLGVQGKVICIDPLSGYYDKHADPYSGFPVNSDIFFQNLRIFGFTNQLVDLRQVKSDEPRAIADLKEGFYATLMIDGDHSRQGVRYDWENYKKYVIKDGIVLFDDYADQAWPEITAFVNELTKCLPPGWKKLGRLGTTLMTTRNGNEKSKDKTPSGEQQMIWNRGKEDTLKELEVSTARLEEGASSQKTKSNFSKHRKSLSLEKVLKTSKKILDQYRNKHSSQRCVILGNGPSLNKMDLSCLKDEITFGMNRIYLLFDKLDFKPTYYVSVNPLVIEQSADEILKIEAPKFLSLNGFSYISDPRGIAFLRSVGRPSFSKDPTNGLWEGYTVTYVAMQLAYFMGFSEVILIGVDHHFTTPGQPNQEVISGGNDPNHFHPDYFGKGTRWNLPDLKNSEIAYRLARQAFETDGRRIIDATADGKLNIFPKVDYIKLFEKYRKIDLEKKGQLAEISFLNKQGEDQFNKGEIEAANNTFVKVIEIAPNYATAHNNLGVLFYNQGDKKRALEQYEHAARLQPENITFQKNLADFYYVVLGRAEEAMRLYVKVLAANPKDIEILLVLGHICVSLKKFDDAKVFYDLILKIEPGHEAAQKNIDMLKKYENGQAEIACNSAKPGLKNDASKETHSQKYLVSAIVSTYNSERFIRGCLEDLEGQTISDKIEIIVVNSGSVQNEEAIVKELQKEYSNIKYIKTEQRETVYAAWNRGIKVASGTYITNANTDDRHRKNAFEVMVNVLEALPEIALAYADLIITELENETLEHCTHAGYFRWLNWNRKDLLERGCFMGPQPMWRRSVHDEYGYFDDLFITSGDYEFWLRISQTNTFLHIPVLLGLYLKHQGSIEHSNRKKQAEENKRIREMYKTAHTAGMIIRRHNTESVEVPLVKQDQHTGTQQNDVNQKESSKADIAPEPAVQIYQNIQPLINSGKHEEAISSLEKLLESYPDFALAHNDLGVLYFNKREKKKALNHYQKAAQLEPNNITFQKNLSDFYYVELGRLEEALQGYVHVLSINPKDVETLLIVGHICVALHKFDDAKVFYGKVLEIEPENVDARQNLDKLVSGQLPIVSGQPEQDIVALKTASFLTNQENDKKNEDMESQQEASSKSIRVSIIIPALNQQKLIKKCVKNIQKYTSEPYEIIFVNKGTKSSTLKWLRSLVNENVNYQLVELTKCANFAKCYNEGIKASSGEYIVLLHGDVVVTEGWLSGLLECINSAPDAGIIGPMTNNANGVQKVSDSDDISLDHLEEFAKSFRERNRYCRVPSRKLSEFCLLFRLELVEKIGPFDESLGQSNLEVDDICLRAALEGYRNIIVGDVFVYKYNVPELIGNKKSFTEKWNGIDAQSPLGKKLLASKALEKAVELDEKGQIDNAVKMLLEGMGHAPKDKRLNYAIVEMLINNKQFKDAFDTLNEMSLDDQDVMKLALIGYCMEGMERYDEIEEYADRALSLDPASALALNLKGILAFGKGDKTTAEDFFKRAIGSDPGYGEPYTNLGTLKWDQEAEEALNLYEKGFILSPTIMDTVTIYHSAVTNLGRFKRAEPIFRDASVLHPNNRRLKFLLTDILVQLGKHDLAMKEIEGAMIAFGIDDGILSAALKVRETLGSNDIEKASKKNDTISLCMIVKNEEQHLGKCLMSVKPVVDEMIVVDTGSTDRTMDIARAFGARVYDFKWTNDFSEARNFSILKASGNWILILDADEVISSFDYASLRKITRKSTNTPIAYSFVTRNYTILTNTIGWVSNDGRYPGEQAGTGWCPSKKVRLFSSDSRIRFENPVHELVEPSLRRSDIKIRECSIPIHHYGKLDAGKVASKGEDYYLLGETKLKEKQIDIQSIIELAVQAGELRRYEDAVELWQRVIAIKPDSKKAFLNIGGAFLGLGKYEDALAASKKAMTLDPSLKEAVLNYSYCEVFIGDVDKAIAALENLLYKVPEYPPATAMLATAYFILGEKEKGLQYINKIKKMGFNSADYLYERAKQFISAGKVDYAHLLLEIAVETDNVNRDILSLFSECIRTGGTVVGNASIQPKNLEPISSFEIRQ